MKERKFNLHDGKAGAAITVRVIPRANSNKISEILDDGTVKVHLTVVPSDEAGNQALLAFLAEVLRVRISQLEIVAGSTGNDKLITITDMDKDTVQDRIIKHLA